MAEVASAVVALIPSFKGGRNEIARQLRNPSENAGRQGGQAFGGSFVGAARSFIGPMLATLTAGAIVGFFRGAITEASGLNESIHALEVTYGGAADAVIALGENAADSLGLSNLEFNNLAVRFSNFANTIGGADAAGTLDDLTTRAADFASVMNIEVADAAALFQSGLAGESEPLRQYGIDLSAATVNAYAYANGIAEQGAQLTEAQRIQATYGSLMEQTSKTAGDFTNTSGELANQQRIMQARLADARAELGTAFLPIMQTVTKFLADEVVPAFASVAEWVNENQWVIGVLAGIIATTLVAAFIAWAASVWIANAALLANPITWIILAIVALVAALIWLIANWDMVSEWLRTTWENALAWAGDALEDFGDGIYDFFSTLPDRILNWLGDLGGLLVAAGQSVIDGFLQGLSDGWANVTGFVAGLAPWIAENKGPLSYDRRLLVPAGKAIMGGLRTSMEGEVGALEATLNGISNVIAAQQFAAQGAAQAGAAGVAPVGDGGFTVNNYGVDANELSMKTERTFSDWQRGEAVMFR